LIHSIGETREFVELGANLFHDKYQMEERISKLEKNMEQQQELMKQQQEKELMRSLLQKSLNIRILLNQNELFLF
jgi:cell division protein ZapA (FtsZ GTPase activity inhibitor)